MRASAAAMAAVRRRSDTRRACMVQLKPRERSAQLTSAQVIEQLRPKVSRHSRHARVSCRCRRRSASAGACRRAATSSRVSGPDTAELYAEARQAASADRRCLPGSGRHQRPADQQPARQYRDRPRQGGGAADLNAQQIRITLTAFGPRWSPPFTRPTTQYRVLLEVCPSTRSTPTRCP